MAYNAHNQHNNLTLQSKAVISAAILQQLRNGQTLRTRDVAFIFGRTVPALLSTIHKFGALPQEKLMDELHLWTAADVYNLAAMWACKGRTFFDVYTRHVTPRDQAIAMYNAYLKTLEK